MKQILVAAALIFSISVMHAQGIKGIIKKASTKDSGTGKTGIGNVISKATGTQLSTADVVSGLKEALAVGTQKSAEKLSAADGFFKDAAIKILLPPEAANVMATVSRFPGGSKMVDDAILSMNRAAEDAAKSAAPIFINAIKSMSINDAFGILRGGDTAATKFLRVTTTNSLTAAFRPVIQNSLDRVNASQLWNKVFSAYNRFSLQKVNPDLTAYVTDKALVGMFHQVALEEQKIRKDPMAQTTDILKKVFGGKQ